MWDQLCDVLTDFEYLQAKIGASPGERRLQPPPATVLDLLRDFLNALAALPRTHRSWSQVLALHDMLDHHLHVLNDDRSLLFPQAYNTLVWNWDNTTFLGRQLRATAQRYTGTWLKRLDKPRLTMEPMPRRRRVHECSVEVGMPTEL